MPSRVSAPAVLTDKAGRIVWNGYPTGVVVVWGMQHGGRTRDDLPRTYVGRRDQHSPFPAAVAFQNTPDALLPEALRAANRFGIQRLVDGRWTRRILPDEDR